MRVDGAEASSTPVTLKAHNNEIRCIAVNSIVSSNQAKSNQVLMKQQFPTPCFP